MQFSSCDKSIEYLLDGNIRFSIACDKDNPMSLRTDITIKNYNNGHEKVYIVKSVETKPDPTDKQCVVHKIIAERRFENAGSY